MTRNEYISVEGKRSVTIVGSGIDCPWSTIATAVRSSYCQCAVGPASIKL